MHPRHELYQSLGDKIETGSISNEELKSAIEAADFDNEQLNQLYLAAVTHLMSAENLSVLSIIPEAYLTHDICLAAIKINAVSKYYFPKDELINYDILLELVRQDGSNLKEVPPSMRDLNICLVAIRGNNMSAIEALPFIPEAFLEQDDFKTVVANCREAITKYGPFLELLPESLRDMDICLTAVKQNWKALQYVPEELLGHSKFSEATTQFHEAIKNNWEMIRDIPPSLITQDDCIAAIKNNEEKGNQGDALKYIQRQFINYDLLKEVTSHVFSFLFLPDYLNNYQTATVLSKEECDAVWFELIIRNRLRWESSFGVQPPRELLTISFCQKIIKEEPASSSELLKYLQDYSDVSILSKQEYREVILSAIKQSGRNIEYAPFDMRDYEICMESVKNNGLALEIIQNYEQTTALNADQFKSICGVAIAQNNHALNYVPVANRTADFCLALVKISGLLLKQIKDFKKTTALNEDEFRYVCQEAVCRNPNAMEFMPKEFLTTDFILEAIEHSMRGKEILSWISEHEDVIKLSAEDYIKIAIAAVDNNPMALENVGEKEKESVIDALTPQKILSINIESIIFFPANPNYTAAHDQLLTNTKHVVVANSLSYDKEVQDVFHVYSNSSQRKGETLFVTKENLNDLLTELEKDYPNPARQINLVLLGHAYFTSKELAGIGADDITNLLINHTNINRVTLLGCNTVQSLKPEQEKAMIRKYNVESNLPKDSHPSSVILLSRMPTTQEYPILLERMRVDRNNSKSDRACILVKSRDKGNEQYNLIYIQKDPEKKEQVIERKHSLDLKQLAQLGKVIGKKNGTIPFPGKNKPAPLYYRGGKGSEFLTNDEFQKITDIINQEAQQFTKGHSSYQKHKKDYPFLTSFEITEAEEAKIMPSLLKIFIDAIKLEPNIVREIVVKGYAKQLHVDTTMRQMTAARTYLYSSEYNKSNVPFFFKSKDNIVRSKLKHEHKKDVADMKTGKLEGETSAKSIKFIIKK